MRMLPRLPLQEPGVVVNFMGMKDEQELLGIYGYGSLDNIIDHYCVKPFKPKAPTTLFDSEKRGLYHKYASPLSGKKTSREIL